MAKAYCPSICRSKLLTLEINAYEITDSGHRFMRIFCKVFVPYEQESFGLISCEICAQLCPSLPVQRMPNKIMSGVEIFYASIGCNPCRRELGRSPSLSDTNPKSYGCVANAKGISLPIAVYLVILHSV